MASDELALQVAEPRRLVISEMVLENFKSYAGVQRVGPFHKSFSSVVGPNGSGKSNVIDAMLFVFGKRAKQLRLNKVSELIHKSTNFRNLDTARVSVHFQYIIDKGEEDYEAVPGTQFVVSRTAHANNSSNYYLGDKRSSYGEVVDLLKSRGIDLDNNRFLILQGEVEQISMMKPIAQTPHETSLLEYLEDIIGTHTYVAPIEEAAKKLEELQEQRGGLVARAQVSGREKEALEGAKAAAEAYLGKEGELLDCRSTLLQLFLRDGQANVDKTKGKLEDLGAKLQHEQAKLSTYNADLKAYKDRHAQEQAEHDAVAAQLESARSKFKEFERKDVKAQEDVKHLKDQRSRLQKSASSAAAKAEEAEATGVEAEAAMPQLQAKAEKLSKQLVQEEQAVEQLVAGCRGEAELHTKALQEVKAEIAPWEAKMAEQEGRRGVAASERDLLAQKHEAAQQRRQEAEQAADRTAKAAAASQKAVSAAQQDFSSRQEAAAGLEAKAAEAQSRVEQLEGNVREVRAKVEQRRGEASSKQSQNAMHKALMAAASNGDIPGIYGRLGDLGSIDAKYDVAVSTAAPQLDYMVVADTGTAQRCIELLRKQGLGVATFLMLDKQAHLATQAGQPVQPPEGVPRLFDLVRVREGKLRPAFYFALRNTLVAKDLDQASRIAYGHGGKWARVVTMQGEMINESGTMSGGGGRPRGGRMCLGSQAPRAADASAAAAELEQAAKDLGTCQKELDTARAKLREAAQTRQANAAALSKAESALPRARLDCAACQQAVQDAQQRLQSLGGSDKVDATDLARAEELEAEIQASEDRMEELRKACGKLQAKAAALQAKLDDVGGPELKQQRAKVAQMQKAIAAAEAEAAKKEVQIAQSRKAVVKLRKDGAKAEEQLAKTLQQLTDQEAAQKELEAAALKVLETGQQVEGQLAQQQASLAASHTEYEEKQAQVGIIRNVEVDLQTAALNLQEAAKAEQVKMRTWRKMEDDTRAKMAERHPTGEMPASKTPEELAGQGIQELEYKIALLESELKIMNPDMGAMEAYRLKDAEHTQRLAELEALTAERDQVRAAWDGARRARLEGFMAGFNAISLKLKEMYQMITLGGDAELELVDSLDPFSEGVVFSVRPPRKSWKAIANLSGGEKTLASLALVFALHHYKPTPLYVMDEIDAALDFKNVSIVAHYIKERTRDAQFVVISLRNNMFELANRLVGIYKTDNTTKSVAINPAAFVVGSAEPVGSPALLPGPVEVA